MDIKQILYALINQRTQKTKQNPITTIANKGLISRQQTGCVIVRQQSELFLQQLNNLSSECDALKLVANMCRMCTANCYYATKWAGKEESK